jgi:hypothetical protein
MTLKPKLSPHITLQPIPKILARTAMAGEWVKNLGGSAEEVETAQRGLALGYIRRISIYGLDQNDETQREKVDLNFDDDTIGDIELDTSGGKSITEALEPGLAKALAFAKRQFQKQGLTPQTQFLYREAIYADPAKLAEVRELLGTSEGEPPPIAEGYEERQFLTMRPGKDPGTLVSMSTRRKSRGGRR